MIIRAETSGWNDLWVLAVLIRLPPSRAEEHALRIIKIADDRGLPYTQVVRPEALVGPLHVSIASVTAYRRHSAGKGIARSPSIELLLRLAGERQVSRALGKLGVRRGAEQACLISVSHFREKMHSFLEGELKNMLLGECRWGGIKAAALYGFNPESCISPEKRCAEIRAASMAVRPEVS